MLTEKILYLKIGAECLVEKLFTEGKKIPYSQKVKKYIYMYYVDDEAENYVYVPFNKW